MKRPFILRILRWGKTSTTLERSWKKSKITTWPSTTTNDHWKFSAIAMVRNIPTQPKLTIISRPSPRERFEPERFSHPGMNGIFLPSLFIRGASPFWMHPRPSRTTRSKRATRSARTARTTWQGTGNLALAGQQCEEGTFMIGFDEDGTIRCSGDRQQPKQVGPDCTDPPRLIPQCQPPTL